MRGVTESLISIYYLLIESYFVFPGSNIIGFSQGKGPCLVDSGSKFNDKINNPSAT